MRGASSDSPPINGKAQTAKDCQAERTRPEKLGEPWRELSARQLEFSFADVALCSGVDPMGRDAYKKITIRILLQLHGRMGRFIEDTGRWNSFEAWDNDPARES